MLLHITCAAQSWLPLGPDDFNYTSPGSIDDCNFTSAPDGTLYMAYEDYDYNFKLTVRKHDGSKWSYVGIPGFSSSKNIEFFKIDEINVTIPFKICNQFIIKNYTVNLHRHL